MELQKKIASPKLIVIGFARHGKDTVCELLAHHGYTFKSSSMVAGLEVVYPVLKDKYNYQTFEECFADRMNHRQEWFELISNYNYAEPDRLAKRIFSQADIYCGLRKFEELAVIKRKTNAIVIWVDASKIMPPESAKSCTIAMKQADIILDNNFKDLGRLKESVELLVRVLNDERSVVTSNGSTVITIKDGVVHCQERVK